MQIIIDQLKHGKNMTCKTDDKIMAIDISDFDKNTLLFAKKDLDSKIRIAFSCDNQPFVNLIAEILEEYVKHKTQIRQEVVQEIKQLVIESTCYDNEEDVRNHLYDMSAGEVLEILDKVEGRKW